LSDAELRTFWHASGRMGYPYGPALRLLALTGCRREEVGAASWSEIDVGKAVFTVPPARFKTNATHVVPLSADALAIIAELPRWEEGDYVFSTRDGRMPIDGWSKAKARLDQFMAEEMGREVEPFVIHDVRRTVRTRLSSLVPSEIAELVIGHTLKGMHKVYDQHTYLSEKRDALERWAAKLRDITQPPPENVVPIKKARRARA
jgi:integrase